MLIDAPFTIGIVDSQESGARELHFTFTDSFRSASLEQRSQTFQAYVNNLQEAINKLDDDNPDRIGMQTIHQISSELLPHIGADEIPLYDPIIVEIGQDAVMVNLLHGVPIQ
jgi:hypothetical protein